MTLSLYAATVPSYQQILGAVAGVLTAAENFCSEKGISHAEIIEARLAQDMHPLGYQVKSTAVHSLFAGAATELRCAADKKSRQGK